MTRGLLLGKFLPPHRGHQYLVDFARNWADHVTVHVCSTPREPIAGKLRFAWMQEQFGGCRGVSIVHNDDPNPQVPEDDPEHFWDIWRDSLRRHTPHDDPIDFVFASEPYGNRLAETLGARFIPVDLRREIQPVSGSQIRADPMRYWEYLIPPARPYFARRVALVGPESSGKSTLSARLAKRFQTVHAPEYARGFLDAIPQHWLQKNGTNGFSEEALLLILRGQRVSVGALLPRCNRVLISDTEAIVTACWSQVLLGYVPPLVEEYVRTQTFDLYLLTSTTEEWADDHSRVQPNFAARQQFEQAVRGHLEANRYPYLRLTGTWEEREAQAVAALERLIAPTTG